MNIPKRLFLYWGRNKPLSYLRYLTVKSFMSLNPDWEVVVYYPTETYVGEDWDTGEQSRYQYKGMDYYLQLVRDMEDEEMLELRGFDFDQMGIPKNTPEVIRSDILRLHLLHEEGGVWSDFDIFYIKPMSKFSFVNGCEAYVCNNDQKYFSIGFLMGAKGNKLYQALYAQALYELVVGNSNDYQRVGSKLFRTNIGKDWEYLQKDWNIANIEDKCVYPIAYNKVQKLFHNDVADLEHSIGVHWFGGNSYASAMDNRLTPDNIDDFTDSTMKRLVQEMNLVTA